MKILMVNGSLLAGVGPIIRQETAHHAHQFTIPGSTWQAKNTRQVRRHLSNRDFNVVVFQPNRLEAERDWWDGSDNRFIRHGLNLIRHTDNSISRYIVIPWQPVVPDKNPPGDPSKVFISAVAIKACFALAEAVSGQSLQPPQRVLDHADETGHLSALGTQVIAQWLVDSV